MGLKFSDVKFAGLQLQSRRQAACFCCPSPTVARTEAPLHARCLAARPGEEPPRRARGRRQREDLPRRAGVVGGGGRKAESLREAAR
jgi:hypothetical protein